MTGALAQADALTRTFLTRFFESEMTAGTDDLKGGFFWLMAALAMPGIFIPWLMVFDWNMIGLFEGYEALRVASRGEKSFYLGLSMLSAGIVATIAWSSLLPDRRDTLILGALPVRPHVVVVAKIAALGAYSALVALGTHAAGSIFWGSILGANGPLQFMVMGIVAHVLAASAMSAWVCLAIAGTQGLALAVVGPRWFQPVSTVLQIAVVGLLAVFLSLLPGITSATAETVSGGPRAEPWLLWLPPLWFLGLYESMLGDGGPVIGELARRALAASAAVVALVLVSYPLAYRRLMTSVVEAGSRRRNPVARAMSTALVKGAGRDPAAQATADFFIATLARVERQRFVLAIALGVALAWGLPALRSYVPSPQPQASLLALPTAAMLFLLAGLRIASSLPSDVRAGWLFEVHDLSRRHARQGLERTMIALGVLPPLLISSAIFWQTWGAGAAITHALVMFALGLAATELLIWHCNGMPCGEPWVPARASFGRRWPVHAGLFLIVVTVIPKLEVRLLQTAIGSAIFLGLLFLLALSLRLASARHEIVPTYEEIDPVAGVLRIQR